MTLPLAENLQFPTDFSQTFNKHSPTIVLPWQQLVSHAGAQVNRKPVDQLCHICLAFFSGKSFKVCHKKLAFSLSDNLAFSMY